MVTPTGLIVVEVFPERIHWTSIRRWNSLYRPLNWHYIFLKQQIQESLFKSIHFLTDKSLLLFFTNPIHKFQKGKLPQENFMLASPENCFNKKVKPWYFAHHYVVRSLAISRITFILSISGRTVFPQWMTLFIYFFNYWK